LEAPLDVKRGDQHSLLRAGKNPQNPRNPASPPVVTTAASPWPD
jgi:hypothetical protein